MKILKIKEWLVSGEPQFKILAGERLPPGVHNMIVFMRLSDNKKLMTNWHFASNYVPGTASEYISITNLHDDFIHLDYVINPGIIGGTCMANDLIISDDFPPVVKLHK